jgi:hypothetical protein
MTSREHADTGEPISLGATETDLEAPRQLAHRLLSAWFAAHERPFVQTGASFAATIAPRGEGEAPIELRIGVTPDPVGVLFSASAAVRYERASWPAALATCNQWNGQVPVPTARLAVESWDDDRDAPVVLEAWLPLTPTTSQLAVNTMGDAVVRGVLGFWRPKPPTA